MGEQGGGYRGGGKGGIQEWGQCWRRASKWIMIIIEGG